MDNFFSLSLINHYANSCGPHVTLRNYLQFCIDTNQSLSHKSGHLSCNKSSFIKRQILLSCKYIYFFSFVKKEYERVVLTYNYVCISLISFFFFFGCNQDFFTSFVYKKVGTCGYSIKNIN
jgi:hypothetical protein